MIDHRKSPPFSITNELIGQALQSLSGYVQWVGETALREQAAKLTSRSNLSMIGVTHPVSDRWQLGADVRVSNVSGTAAAGDMPAGAGTGNILVYSAQAIGNAILRDNDLGVLNLSLIRSPTYTAHSLSLNYVYLYSDSLRIDGSVRWYGQSDRYGARMSRLTPTVKAIYKLRERLFLDAEGAIERTTTKAPASTEHSRRYFFYTGYRWDIY